MATLHPASPLDVHYMPRILQAFYCDAMQSKSQLTARVYVRLVKHIFKNYHVAIEDMISEEYVAMVKRVYEANAVSALRCFAIWFRNHGLSAHTYDLLPEVVPESAHLYRIDCK